MHLTLSDMAREVEAKAPLVYKLLSELVQPADSCRASSQSATQGSIIVAVAVLLRQRNTHMNALQYIMGVLLWQGHATKEVRSCICNIAVSNALTQSFTYVHKL